MAEDLSTPVPTPVAFRGKPTLVTRDLHVVYRVYEDRHPRLREVFSNRLRRPAHREINAVKGVDLTAYEGEAIGLIGPNGSGKSTLLQAVAGLLPATQGEVYAKSQPSLLGVNAALQRGVSGRRNITLGGLALGMSRAELRQRMDEIIEFAGLEDFIDLPIRTYSSGMRARLHFAIATAVSPEILLIDEALATGDEVFKERSRGRIDELLEKAGTVFLVSHTLGLVKEICSRCLWLDHGQLVMDGDPDEVIAAYQERTREMRRRRKGS